MDCLGRPLLDKERSRGSLEVIIERLQREAERGEQNRKDKTRQTGQKTTRQGQGQGKTGEQKGQGGKEGKGKREGRGKKRMGCSKKREEEGRRRKK